MKKANLNDRLTKYTENLIGRNENIDSDVSTTNYNNSKENISGNISGNIDSNNNTIINVDKINDINNNNYNANTIDDNSARNIDNTIVINKTVEPEKSKRVSYYLKVSTIKTIEQLAKKSNKGISAFLQELLDSILNNIEIK